MDCTDSAQCWHSWQMSHYLQFASKYFDICEGGETVQAANITKSILLIDRPQLAFMVERACNFNVKTSSYPVISSVLFMYHLIRICFSAWDVALMKVINLAHDLSRRRKKCCRCWSANAELKGNHKRPKEHIKSTPLLLLKQPILLALASTINSSTLCSKGSLYERR